jgi:ergothioneine biosynthesis protein EgtB
MSVPDVKAAGTPSMQVLSTDEGAPSGSFPVDSPSLTDRFDLVRTQTDALCQPLEVEDCVVSSMPDVSPTKWHLAHTSWFFETFVLREYEPSYRSPDDRYAFLFNSYYVQAGERHCRAQRGLATRPTLREVFAYRRHVEESVRQLLHRFAGDPDHPAAALIELGLQHEQQHQELLLTDIKHVLWTNPLRPAYRSSSFGNDAEVPEDSHVGLESGWQAHAEGVYMIGHEGAGYAFDNEAPRHRVFLEPFRIANRLITNGEYLDFIRDEGYRRPELWLSAGLATVEARDWAAPLYWEQDADGGWTEFTLAGTRPLTGPALKDPVCHMSYYEADAFARWAGHRLPSEFEWEVAAREAPVDGRFVEAERFHPGPAISRNDLEQLYGDSWQWTQSAYLPYPNYRPASGAIGEYNGKWMADQWVLRGASCATPRSHARLTYRNFFPSDARWQFTGIRLATGA